MAIDPGELAAAIRGATPEMLTQLLEGLIRSHPEAAEVIEIELGMRSADPQASVDGYRQRMEEVFDAAISSRLGPGAVEAGAAPLEDIGDAYLAAGRALDAVAVFAGVAAAIVKRCHEADEDGEMGMLAEDFAAKLGTCLQRAAPAERPSVIRTMLELMRLDAGTWLVEVVLRTLLVNKTTDDEKTALAGWLREELERHRTEPDLGIVNLALDLDGELDEGQRLGLGSLYELCCRTRRPARLVRRLLSYGRIEEAVHETRAAPDDALPALASLVAEAGHAHAAERIVLERLRLADCASSRAAEELTRWLRDFYVATGRPAAALGCAQSIFLSAPTVDRFRDVQRLAEPLGRWAAMRADLLTALAGRESFGALAEIHLAEGELDRAIAATERDDFAFGSSIAVARAAEAARPEASLRIYRRHVDALIERRKRSRYRDAATFLARMKSLFERVDQRDRWAATVQQLRQEYGARHALMDEMRRAGLL